jgi:hypothetical protein
MIVAEFAAPLRELAPHFPKNHWMRFEFDFMFLTLVEP